MEKPTRSLISFIFILSIPYLILAQNAGDYRSKVASGNWSSPGSWEVFDGTNWVGAATAPNSANGIITIRSPHVITLNSTVTADQIVVESGGSLYINNPGVLNLNDDTGEDLVCSGFIWHTNGTINGPGTIRINSGGTIQLSNGTAQTMVIATTLTNFGTVYWSNNTAGGSSTSTLTLTNGKIINNAAFTVNSTSGPISEKINGGDIINNGTITYSSSSSVPNFTMNVNKITNNLNASIIANANGALIIQAAVGDTHEGTFTSNSSNGLKFTGAAIQTYTSNCTFNGSGFIEFNQGTHTFNANYNAGSTRITGATTVYNYSSLNFNNLYLSGGTFGGPCVKNMNGNMGWDGGMVSGGDLIIPATKSLAIGGGAYVTWTLACNLTNNGSIGLANANPGCCGTSTLAMSGQTITNNGSFVISYSGYAGGTTQKISGGTFINNGILKTTSHINNVELNLSSFVNNQTGLVFAEGNGRLTLNITSGSVNDGDFQSNSTTGMLFTGPAAMTYDINSDFTGSGKFEFQSGTHTLNGAYHGSSTILSGAAINFNMPNVNFNYIALTAGTFSGIGSRTCNNIDWTGGTIAGAPLSQASGSQLNMIVPTSGTTYNLNTTFTCNGNITWTNNPGGSQSSTLNLASGNLINNGTMNINMGVNNTNTISNGQLTNNGIFNRNANGTFNFQSSATLTNTGTLNFFAGSSVLGTQNLGGIINLTSGVFNCNTVNFNGTVLNMTGSALINSSINFNFTGNTLQSFNGDGTSTIERMGMNASGGLIINANQLTVNSTLTYTNGIIYATYGNLVLNGSLVGNGSSTAYVVTNGSAGFLRNLNSIATFTFPVGTTSGFSPIDVQILSTAGQGLHAVRVFDNVYSSYSPSGNGSPAGPSITSAQVNRSWVVWKWNGGTINAKLNLKWLTNEESPDFNRNLCRIAKYDANTNNWTLESQTSGGSGPLFSVASSAQTSFTTSNIYCVIGQFTTATQTIAPQCAGNSISINYKAIGSFTSGNAFTAQLSDANGDFTSAVNIGSLNSTTDGIISCIIPSNTPAGTGYRIRVVSSMPVSKGSDNGSNITIFQSITYYADDDHDGYGDPIHFLVSCSGPPNGYVNNNLDCDDTNVNVHPNATEICNLIDDDCDGLIDDADPGIVGRSTWNADADGDGFGDANNSVLACVQPNGYVSNGNDCNDANASVHPGAGEFCNDYDDDCDGLIDDNDPEITGQPTWYVDADGDGYGDASNSVLACVQPNGYVSNGDDCNDANAAVHPGAGEFCNDYDDDCDGLIDDNDPEITGQPTWYADTDGDGFGDPSNSVLACVQPNGYVSNGNDCNDANATVHPGAGEFCNDYDDDCDGLIDDNDPEITGQPTWYADADGDGFGDVNNSVLACVQPNGYVSNSDDCNDANASVHPGVGEFCNDYDDDCDGLIDDNDPEIKGQPTWYVDADGDGYGDANNSVLACLQPSDYVSNGDDCNDSNSAIHPGAGEFCNGYDDNCDGLIDDNDPEITGQPTWYADVDGDGFGDVNNLVLACVQPYGYVSNGDDCNDSNNAIHPGAGEFCNDYDDDCDGLIDDNDPEITGQPTWYADTDGDGFGDPNNPVLACVQPNGYVSNGDDCNDSNASIHPGAGEFCNDYDDDCDGLIDDNDPEITGQLTWYADTDGDGYGDANNSRMSCNQPAGYVMSSDDQCPLDPFKKKLGNCGCGHLDIDTDQDGIMDCMDSCPAIPGQIGSPCDDGNSCTTNDKINSDCNCVGTPIIELKCSKNITVVTNPYQCDATAFFDPPSLYDPCNDFFVYKEQALKSGDKFNLGITDITYKTIPLENFNNTIFAEDFSDNSAGWSYDGEWYIGSAMASNCSQYPTIGEDPEYDHSPTDDNGIAGTNIGSCIYPYTTGSTYYLTSPVIDVSNIEGALKLDYWRHLHSDIKLSIINKVEVFDGNNWIVIQEIGSVKPNEFTNDVDWNYQSLDVTAYKNSTFQFRFGYLVKAYSYRSAGWSVDDVTLTSGSGANSSCTFTVQVDENPESLVYEDQDKDGFGDPGSYILSCMNIPGYVANNFDLCPLDPNKVNPESCGCGNPEKDSDNDYIPDCIDPCLTELPVCPGNITVVVTYPNCSATGINLSNPEPGNSCDILENIENNHPSNEFPIGITNVNWTMNYIGSNRIYTCIQNVEVTESQEKTPILKCPDDILVNASPGVCGAWIEHGIPEIINYCIQSNLVRISGPPSSYYGAENIYWFSTGSTNVSYGATHTYNPPVTIFEDDFSDNSAGWTMDNNWEIGNALNSSCSQHPEVIGNDPSYDHTNSGDNGLAGVVIGGCPNIQVHDPYYLTSPIVDVSGISGALTLEFWRHLHSDLLFYIGNTVEVYDGAKWVVVKLYGKGSSNVYLNDLNWTFESIDITAYKNDHFQFRFGFEIKNQNAFSSASWSIDDVRLLGGKGYSATCSFNVEVIPDPTDVYYLDSDGDGFGDPEYSQVNCNGQPEGYVANKLDCDDSNASIHPAAVEFCNGYDDDCDGLIDDNDPEITGQPTWYADTDGDGFGDANNSVLACVQPNGYVSNGDDCNDANASIHPGVGEFCNDYDDDCDGLIDDNDPEITGQPTWYADTDGDGYGDANNAVLACVQPNRYVSNGDDCNDVDASIHPNAAEICGNNVDENCDNLIDENCCVAPQIVSCPSDISVNAATNACSKIVNYPSATANGTGPINIAYSKASGASFPVGITTVLVTAENNCGADNCSFKVEVVDNQKPIISCKNITLSLDANGVAVVNPDLVVLSVYDNCGILSKVTSPAVLDCDHLGSNQVTLIVTDIHNNSSTCIANVNVIDNIKPFAKCKDLTVSLSMSGTVLVQGFELDGGSSDNCEIASYPNSTYILNCNNLGKNNLVMNVFDKSNNSASCISEVTVIDNLGPKVTCNNLTVKLNNGGQANVNVNEIQSSLDNCGVSQIEYKKKFDCTDLGVNNVLVTVSDASGNSSTCNSIVTVSDKILPDAKCKNSNKYVYLKNGYATLSVDDIDQNSKDNCSIVSRTLSQSNFNCSDIGPHSIFLTVTDQSGNSSNCATNVVVIGPMPVCYLNVVPENNINTGGIPTNIYLGYGPQKDTIKCVANGGTGFTYSWSPVSNLSCSTCSQPVFSPATAGNYTYTVTVTNASGCSSTCSVSFCVKDIKVPGSNGSYVYVCHSGVSSLILPLAQVPLHVPGHALDKLGKCTDLCPSTPSTLSNTGVYSMNNQDTNNFSNELAGYANSEFKIYPNPSFDQFIVSNQNYKIQNLKIEVVDLFGRIIETKEWNDNLAEHSFGLHYRSGVYLVKIQSGEMSTVYRVVKQE
jgi:hypothetical protein